MFDDMFDVASQLMIKVSLLPCQSSTVELITKWHRFGETRVDVCSDFTKATLDTIALCTFSYRFNSFYTDQNHPFVDAMAGSLRASSDRMRRLPGTGWMYVKANKRFKDDIKTLHDLCDEVGYSDALYRHRADADSLSRLERIVGRDAKISWIGCCTEEIR